MTISSQASLPPGTMVGGYRIECEVGRGAMAVVYRAIQLNLDRPVALKVLGQELAENDEFVVRFFNEARAAAALSHAHIIQAYDAGVAEGGIHYFAMEFVEGETLLNRIERQSFIRPGPGLSIACDMADALNYGWQRQKLTHGDIKPENIMINTTGETKLADFGLAKVAEHDFEGSEIMLTPLYAAPEMIRGHARKGDCRSDIYSFGATLYHMFGGSPPFPGTQAQQVMDRHLTEELEPLKSRNPVIPAGISQVVGTLLEKEPEQRPQSWEEVLKELRSVRSRITERSVVRPALQVSADSAAVARRAAAASRQSRSVSGTRFWLWPALVVSVVLAAGLLIWHFGGRDSAAEAPAGPSPESASSDSSGPSAESDRTSDGKAPLDWETVKQKVDTFSNPTKALALLEAFRDQAGDTVPADFSPLYEQYREAAEWRRAAEREADRSPWRYRRREEGATRNRDGETQTADTQPDQATDTEESRNQTVGTPPEQAPEQDRPQVRDTIDVSVSVPRTDADIRRDRYAEYMAELGQLEYDVGRSVEPYVQAGRKWLDLYSAETTPERDRVAFLVNTALPALDESLPRLIANKGKLVGEKMPGKKYESCTVRDITLAGIEMEETTRHGKMIRNVTWTELGDPGYLVYFNRAIVAEDAPLAERRSLLALILFTRFGKLWDSALEPVPEVPEKRLWETTRVELEQAGKEGDSLHLWREILTACDQGDRVGAYRLIRRLQQTRSATAFRYRDVLETLVNAVAGAVPEYQAGVLLRRAREMINTSPADALVLINVADARYGNADFPEKDTIPDLRRAAVAGLPRLDWMNGLVRQYPTQLIAPFTQDQAGTPPATSMILLQELKKLDPMPPQAKDMLPLMEALAAMEMGNWATAQPLLQEPPSLSVLTRRRVPLMVQASLVYSWGLLDDRYSSTPPQAEQVAADLRTLARPGRHADGRQVATAAMLLVEYALVTRQVSLPQEEIVRWNEVQGVADAGTKRRFLLSAVSFLVESGSAEDVLKRLAELMSSPAAQESLGLREADRELLSGVTRVLDGRQADERMVRSILARRPSEWVLRALTSVLLFQDALSSADARALSDYIVSEGLSFGPVGGTASYDLVLSRVGDALSSGDLPEALSIVQAALDLHHPSLFPYYARLLFLRAGLYALAGADGRLSGLVEEVKASPMASKLEETLARCLVRDSDSGRSKIQARTQTRLWYAWVTGAMRLHEKGDAERDKVMSWFSNEPLTLAEKRLTNGLDRFAALKWSAVANAGN